MTLAVVDDREVARQQELREREREVAEAVKTQDALLLLVRSCSLRPLSNSPFELVGGGDEYPPSIVILVLGLPEGILDLPKRFPSGDLSPASE